MKRLIVLFWVLLWGISVHAQERQIKTSDGVKLYVKVKGSGMPCLYLHGGPGAGSFWLEKYFGHYLEQNFQMIYLDQRGSGRSTSPKNHNYSMDRMARDFEEVRKALGIKMWITLGHSFGGVLQMGYLERYPESVSGMIMINCTLSIEESLGKSWIIKASEFLGNKDHLSLTDSPDSILARFKFACKKLISKNISWKMNYASPKTEILVNATYEEFLKWNDDFNSKAFSIKDYWFDYRKKTSEITIPVLFFYGQNDWVIGPEHYKGIKFPDMILWGSEVGHMPFLENKPDLKNAIDSFIHKYRL